MKRLCDERRYWDSMIRRMKDNATSDETRGEAVEHRGVVTGEGKTFEGASNLHERHLEEVIDERDSATSWADRLAFAIGRGEEGEHSNLHNPWAEAEQLAQQQRQELEALRRRTRWVMNHLAAGYGGEVCSEVRRILEGKDDIVLLNSEGEYV